MTMSTWSVSRRTVPSWSNTLNDSVPCRRSKVGTPVVSAPMLKRLESRKYEWLLRKKSDMHLSSNCKSFTSMIVYFPICNMQDPVPQRSEPILPYGTPEFP